MKKTTLILALLLLPALSFSQITSDGTDFYIGSLFPSFNNQDLKDLNKIKDAFNTSILVSSYSDNQVTISYFDASGAETVSQVLSVPKFHSIQVPIDESKMRLTDPGEVAEFRSMHVTATAPVSVQFLSAGANSCGSYLSIPTPALGKNYVVESYHDNSAGEGGFLTHDNSSGYFMVIATADNTNLQITPNSTTKMGKPGVTHGVGSNVTPQPFTVSLQRGQCYMVKSSSDNSTFDISGSTVISDKPVAVIGGHEDAFVNGSDVGTITVDARDFMIEQMLPVELWDTAGYISVPMADSKNGVGGDGDNIAFFYGKPLDAPVTYPATSSVTVLPSNVQLPLTQYPSVVALQSEVTTIQSASSSNGAKIHMVQYDQRMQGVGPFPAPSQTSIIPMSRWKSSYLWYIPSGGVEGQQYHNYYATVICDKDDYNVGLQMTQDGGTFAPIKAFGTVGGTKSIPGFPNLIAFTMKLAAPRTYYAATESKKPFMIYSYGFRAYDPDRALGNFDGDDHFFSYSAPAGFGTPGEAVSAVELSAPNSDEMTAIANGRSLTITLPTAMNGAVTIELYDLLGRSVMTSPIENAGMSIVLPLPKLSAGVYFIRAHSESLTSVCKLTIQ